MKNSNSFKLFDIQKQRVEHIRNCTKFANVIFTMLSNAPRLYHILRPDPAAQ